MEVVDGLDIEAFSCADVFEDLPVGACRPGLIVSPLCSRWIRGMCLRALEQGDEEAGRVQRHRVEDHQTAKPLV